MKKQVQLSLPTSNTSQSIINAAIEYYFDDLKFDMQLILLRHAESEDNQSNILGGNAEAVLTAKGREQATAAGKSINQQFKVTKAFTSPRKRCLETAEIVLSELDHKIDLVISENLTEREFGSFTGRPLSEVNFAFIDNIQDDNQYRIESLPKLQSRVEQFLMQLKYSCNDNDNVLIVTHSNPLRFFTVLLEGISFTEALQQNDFPNAGFKSYNF